MLPRKLRFHGRSSLKQAYAHGQTVRDEDLAIRYKLNPKRKNYRCAVVVSKKVEKSAVKRNRIRRRIYEHISTIDAKITEPYDIVVTVYSPTLGHMPAKDFQAKVNKLLANAKLTT